MNKSIYTEYANLTPYHIKWLDGCGATWGDGTLLKDYPPSNTYLFFNGLYVDKFSQSARITEHQSDYTHAPTGDAFCQGVAEILGIEYVPEKPFTRKLINKLELHNKMERPLPEGTISKTETTTEDKGLAIDVKLLSEEDREWIVETREKPCDWNMWKYAVCEDNRVILYDNFVGKNFPITTDPEEFMRYVATKTGKEWGEKPMFGKNQIEIDLDEQLFLGRQNMGEGALTNEDVIRLLGDKVGYGSYKTYRILDSLDGVPLDRRIPLSEWIPPFGTKVKFEFPDNIIYGRVNLISKDGIEVLGKFFKCYVGADGHWMRIV